jgi:PBSX family phage terminase large subunit
MLTYGGSGCGKTVGGALRTADYMIAYGGCQGIIVAPTYKQLRRASLDTLFNVFADRGMQHGVHYEYNKTEETITLWNDSRALGMSTEIPENLAGPSCQFVWHDEGAESPERSFQELAQRLRQRRSGQNYPLQYWITTTPRGKDHWLYKTFFQQEEFVAPEIREKAEYHTFPALTKDNILGGGPEKHALMASLYGEGSALFRQQALGEFVVAEGLVYPMFERDYHVVDESLWPGGGPTRFAAGVDFGWNAPSVIVVLGMDEDGRYYWVDEVYEEHLSQDQLADYCQDLMHKYDIETFVCDSRDPRWIADLRAQGVPARKADGGDEVRALNPTAGIATVSSMLNHRIDGAQACFFSPKCRNTAREFENYVIRPSTDSDVPSDTPQKKNDHAPDATRYCALYMKARWPTSWRDIGEVSGPQYILGGAAGRPTEKESTNIMTPRFGKKSRDTGFILGDTRGRRDNSRIFR